MKKLGFLLFMFFPIVINAQNFAPVGAEWYYTEYHAFSELESFLYITSVKDTSINGTECRVLENNRGLVCNFYNERDFVYDEDSVVYFYSPVIDDFQVLYNLKAKKDSSWTVIYQVEDFKIDTIEIIVDSVKSVTINGIDLLAFDVTYQSLNTEYSWDNYSSTIIERIGDQYYLFNLLAMAEGIVCDGNYSGGIRCYQDNILGLYTTGIADSCTYVTNINEHRKLDKLDVFPNPFSSSANIEYQLDQPSEVTLTIFNHLGKQVELIQQYQQAGKQSLTWQPQGLPPGMYYFTLWAGDITSSGKVIYLGN